VARVGSIHNAAERPHVSPSTVNNRILNLESAYGVPLFERLPRGVRLTAAGEMLRERVRRWHLDHDQARLHLQELQELRRGHVNLGLMERLASDFVAAVFAQSPSAIGVQSQGTDIPSATMRCHLEQAYQAPWSAPCGIRETTQTRVVSKSILSRIPSLPLACSRCQMERKITLKRAHPGNPGPWGKGAEMAEKLWAICDRVLALRLAIVITIAVVLGAVPAPAQTYDHINIATNAEPDSLDMLTSIFPPVSFVVLRNVSETLWGYNNDGAIRRTVATWTIADGGKTITFHLRHGIHFQSGDELIAADIPFSFERMERNTPAFMRHARLVDKIEVFDKYTVRFTWKHPDVTLFDGMQLFLGSKAYFDRVGEHEFTRHLSGIGPYRIVDYSPGQYIDLKRFEGYYGPKPPLESARFYFIKDDETRVAKLKSGEADIIMDTPYPEVKVLAEDGFKILKFPANPTVSVIFDLLSPQSPWHKLQVRQAIAHAIDDAAIVKGLFQGIPQRFPMLAPGEEGYDPKYPISNGTEPHPNPMSRRPRLRWSSMQISSSTRSG
jgi:Bacterial extracellular solute-binding proteins, family 5 Middle/Bacterial regulatory helix-turn-helix protein, lysR family